MARFDIAAYDTAIRHDVLLDLLAATGARAEDVAVVRDDMTLPDTRKTGRGMVASGGLSLLLGGLYLDDVVLLTKSRWQLQRAIAALHAVLRPLHLRLHRVKRFIGRTSTGFDLLGYRHHLSFGHPRRVCAASACVLVGSMSEKATLSPFDGTCSGGGAGSTEACRVGCAGLEVLSASHDMCWHIYAIPGRCAVTAETAPRSVASRRGCRANA